MPALAADDSDMDLTSTEDTVGERIDKEELDTPLHESELRSVMLSHCLIDLVTYFTV